LSQPLGDFNRLLRSDSDWSHRPYKRQNRRCRAHRTPPGRTRAAEHVEARAERRGRPPGCLPFATGNFDSWKTHFAQYTPALTPVRSQSAPHPSQTFNSKRKYFIVDLQGTVNPRRASEFFSGRRGSLRLLGSADTLSAGLFRPHRFGVATYLSSFKRLRTQGNIPLPPLHFFPLLPSVQDHAISLRLSWSLREPGIEGLKVIAFDNFYVNFNLSSASFR